MATKKLKIAQITPYFLPAIGGIEKATYEISKRLVAKGHRVTVYTSRSKFNKFNILPEYEEIEGIRVKRYKEYFNLMGAWFPKIAEDEEILHLINYCLNPHTYLIRKYFGKKRIVVTFHGGFSRYEGDFKFQPSIYGIGKFFWQYLFGKRYLKKIDKLIALHEWEKENLIEKGAPSDKIVIIPNGMGDEAFERYLPKKFDKPYILSLCRIAKVKSLDQVIKILPDIKDCYYVIAGKDIGEGELENLKQLARELRVEKRVKFVGEIRGRLKYRFLSGAELVIVPSIWEMLSLTVLETMAQGKIVIASDSYGNPYIIDDKKNGFIYRHGDLASLKKLVLDILADKRKFEYIGKNARTKIRKSYRWEKVTELVEKAYYDSLFLR